MGNCKFSLQSFAEPPEKVKLMFQAVIELLNERRDGSDLKVSDITSRAGIGKGTAYEYFSTKEDIISMALLYDYKERLLLLEKKIQQQKNFQEKVYDILDWIHDHISYHENFIRMMQSFSGNTDMCDALSKNLPEEVLAGMEEYLFEEGNAILEQGYKENYFTEKDPVKRRVAFAAAVVQYGLSIEKESDIHSSRMKYVSFHLEDETAKEFAYESLIKSLN